MTIAEMTNSTPLLDHGSFGGLIMEDGIYFGMHEDQYHSAFALSASGIKHMRISTLDFWARSPLNPSYEEEDREALRIGRAYHKRIIEGKEAFDVVYAPAWEPSEGMLRIADDLRDALASRGLKTGGRKHELIERLVIAAPSLEARIADRAEEAYLAHHIGKEFLSSKLIDKIEIAAKMIEAHPVLSRAFTGGYPEVSIFWTDKESGVPCKARLDYLKAKAIVDLKSFDPMGMPIDKAIARAVATYKYHIQAAMYLEAVEAAKELIGDDKIFGNVERSFLKAIAESEEHTFLFVFQATGIAPISRGKIMPNGITLDLGRMEIEQAKEKFSRCWQIYGRDPWVDITEIAIFDTTEFPSWIAE